MKEFEFLITLDDDSHFYVYAQDWEIAIRQALYNKPPDREIKSISVRD